MEREIIITSDGSTTIRLPEWNEHYHSTHGAIQESNHVFIKQGLNFLKPDQNINILELGFGTGLNCFMTYLSAKEHNLNINYTGIEAYPLKTEELEQLNYVTVLNATKEHVVFDNMHSLPWEEKHQIAEFFTLVKQEKFIEEIKDVNKFDLIYFDAFGPQVQPELWTEIIFYNMYRALKPDGILVTYSAKGSVRRAMQAVGFSVERLAGPPGKREMLRGVKYSK
ncbi:MAG: tRNA (5-methylaminomethyl-2-thiouridine)(34)-methyltransferase MnmD [Flavobacteriaceae bacterium]|nr:tRNA (5-methylaminomethyl-2-thiouridine)(34)-methyltransferase MnmD [Flavobacteriaceae bacterium]